MIWRRVKKIIRYFMVSNTTLLDNFSEHQQGRGVRNNSFSQSLLLKCFWLHSHYYSFPCSSPFSVNLSIRLNRIIQSLLTSFIQIFIFPYNYWKLTLSAPCVCVCMCSQGPQCSAKSWPAWMCVFMFYWQWSALFPKPTAFHSYLILPLARAPRHACTRRHKNHTNAYPRTDVHTDASRVCRFLLTLKSDGRIDREIASWMKLSTFQTIKNGTVELLKG